MAHCAYFLTKMFGVLHIGNIFNIIIKYSNNGYTYNIMIMHVYFIRVNTKNLNSINWYITTPARK